MSLRVVGAGVGRTGTLSLKLALEKLLGGPCYHMAEVFSHPEHVSTWHAAARGEAVDWHRLFAGYRAAVDWPAGAFWPELSAAFPDALIVLSLRDAESWWESVSRTIFPTIQAADGPWRAMIDELFAARFTRRLEDRDACMAAFERHNAEAREGVPRSRLLEWRPQDGWDPLCAALAVPVPDEPFPHVNSTQEFLSRQLPEEIRRRAG